MSSIPDKVKQNTAIILVPGSFTPPSFFTKVSSTLLEHGFAEVQGCPLVSACPASDQRMPPAQFADDVKQIREMLEGLLSRGMDVVVVMNSYGGIPSTEAMKDLPSRGRLGGDKKANEAGAIVGLVYLCSFLPLPGDSTRSIMGDYMFEPLKTGDPGKYMYLPDDSGPGIFSDWAAEGESRDDEIKHWFGNMYTHSSDSFDGKVSHNLWTEGVFQGKLIYIAGENDLVVPPDLFDTMLKKVQEIAGEGKIEVKSIENGGHMMHLTRPDVVVQTVEDLLESMIK